MTHTEADFDSLSWHDCHIWGMQVRTGDPKNDDWTSELVFDIDFIVEWVCGIDGQCQFRVAPATLVFHGVSNPEIHIAWEDPSYMMMMHAISIGNVERERLVDDARPDYVFYTWRISLNWPEGEITFGARGFTQTLDAEPVLTDEQCLSLSARARLRRPSG